MGPSNGHSAGVEARGSWLLEPDTGTGMLLYPRDWSFLERRDVFALLREQGWAVVPVSRFVHISSDGLTVIRLLSQRAPQVNAEPGELRAFPQPAEAPSQIEASL